MLSARSGWKILTRPPRHDAPQSPHEKLFHALRPTWETRMNRSLLVAQRPAISSSGTTRCWTAVTTIPVSNVPGKIAVSPALGHALLAEVEGWIDGAVDDGERLAANVLDLGLHCVLGGLVDRVEGDDGEGGDRCGDDDGVDQNYGERKMIKIHFFLRIFFFRRKRANKKEKFTILLFVVCLVKRKFFRKNMKHFLKKKKKSTAE
jgi:hypothetical protein